MSIAQKITAESLWEAGVDNARFELIRGELHEMSPSGFKHGDVVLEIGHLLKILLGENRLGKVVAGDVGFILSRNPDTVLAPDLAFVDSSRLPSMDRAARYFEGPPDLAVEVRSPYDEKGEIDRKVEIYLASSVRMIWIVDPEKLTVTVYEPSSSPRLLTAEDKLTGGDVLAGFEIPVARIFPK